MIERRISPRNKCPISLAYKILSDEDYRKLLENFDEKRERIVLYDQLDSKNRTVNRVLKYLENDLAPILTDINDQLSLLKKTLSMSFDVLYYQENFEVTINTGGMLFQTTEMLSTGNVIEIQLKLAPEIPRLLMVAEVLRSKTASASKKITTAISFTYIEPDDKTILMEFVKQKLKDKYSDQK